MPESSTIAQGPFSALHVGIGAANISFTNMSGIAINAATLLVVGGSAFGNIENQKSNLLRKCGIHYTQSVWNLGVDTSALYW